MRALVTGGAGFIGSHVVDALVERGDDVWVLDNLASGKRQNVIGRANVLESARDHDAQVVFSSTGGAIYGECDGPADEDSPLLPLAPYGISKLVGRSTSPPGPTLRRRPRSSAVRERLRAEA